MDLKNFLDVDMCIAPAQYTGTKSDGTIIDLQGYESATVMVGIGAVSTADGSNYFTITVTEGDNSALSDGATATKLIGAFELINSTSADPNTVQLVGYYGGKRYVRVVATETGTADATFGCWVIKGHPLYKPATVANS